MAMNDTMQLERFLSEAIKIQVEKEAKILIKEAQEKLIERLPALVTKTTIEVMKFTEFQTMNDRVVFTIRNKE